MTWKYYNPKFDYEKVFDDSAWPWVGHRYFAYDLIANVRPKIIVELGTHYGTSFWSFAQAVKDQNIETELNAVDTWKGERQSGFYGEEVFETVKGIKEKFYSKLRINLIRKTFDETVAGFKDKSIDILHIDGLHTYEAVKHDFETWLPKVNQNGIIIFHDIQVGEDDFGVYKLWNELKKRYATIEFFQSFGLGVLFLNMSFGNKIGSKEKEWQMHYSYIYEMKKIHAIQIKNDQIKLAEIDTRSKIEEINSKNREIITKDQVVQLKDEKIQKISKIVQLKNQELILTKEKLDLTSIELNSTKTQLGSKIYELSEIYASRGWKLIVFLRKVLKTVFPGMGFRKKITNIFLGFCNSCIKFVHRINESVHYFIKFVGKALLVIRGKNNTESYNIQSTHINLFDIPKVAISKIKKYGLRVFIRKSANYLNIVADNKKAVSITTSNPSNGSVVNQILRDKFTNSQPIGFVKVDRDDFRFNIVTDSVQKQSLFGGVATSLILATLFSNKYNIPLRIITRETENNPNDYEKFLDFMHITKPNKIEFFSDCDRNNGGNNFKLETSDKDIFLATSWWSAEAIKSVNLRKNFFYIIQEVEKFFYPNGDDQNLCENILHERNINYIVNSKLLFDYYLINNYKNIVTKGVYFEPAFPTHIYSPGLNSFKQKTKYKLLFYARPNNPRNLFYTGIKILDEAIREGIINMEEWEIYFAGSNIPPLTFSNGKKPIMLGHMDWKEYSIFIKEIDLGLCLMYTPHPSYPPLDIASSGGVVLSNAYLNKRSLEYSKNIICMDLDMGSMLNGVEKSVNLVKDVARRKKNYNDNCIVRNWSDSLDKVLEYINKSK